MMDMALELADVRSEVSALRADVGALVRTVRELVAAISGVVAPAHESDPGDDAVYAGFARYRAARKERSR